VLPFCDDGLMFKAERTRPAIEANGFEDPFQATCYGVRCQNVADPRRMFMRFLSKQRSRE
jgi:hypothetical protein